MIKVLLPSPLRLSVTRQRGTFLPHVSVCKFGQLS